MASQCFRITLVFDNQSQFSITITKHATIVDVSCKLVMKIIYEIWMVHT